LSGNLQVNSDDPDEPRIELPLTGDGAESSETVITLNAREGEIVTWTYDDGRVQRIRVWLDMSLRITPVNPKPVSDHFESGQATVTGTVHLWGNATDTRDGYEEFIFDHDIQLNLQGIGFTSYFDPVTSRVIFLAGRLATLKAGQATPYWFEFEGATERRACGYVCLGRGSTARTRSTMTYEVRRASAAVRRSIS
jgi:hypothetical protein